MFPPTVLRVDGNAWGPAPRLGARLAAGALALAAASSLAAPAIAEELIRAPDAIRACLCHEQLLSGLSRAMADAERAHDAAQQRFQSLTGEARAAQQKLDPADAEARDALGRLLDQRDAAQDQLAATVPPMNDAVARYNDAASAFNTDCAGKAYDPAVLPEAKATLNCPPPAPAPPRG